MAASPSPVAGWYQDEEVGVPLLQGLPAGVRRRAGQAMAAVACAAAVVSVVAAFQTWIVYHGANLPALPISGLSDGDLGVGAIGIGLGLALCGLLAGVLRNPLRVLLPVVPAAGGVVLVWRAWSDPVNLVAEGNVRGAVGAGLMLETIAFGTALACSVAFVAADYALSKRSPR